MASHGIPLHSPHGIIQYPVAGSHSRYSPEVARMGRGWTDDRGGVAVERPSDCYNLLTIVLEFSPP